MSWFKSNKAPWYILSMLEFVHMNIKIPRIYREATTMVDVFGKADWGKSSSDVLTSKQALQIRAPRSWLMSSNLGFANCSLNIN